MVVRDLMTMHVTSVKPETKVGEVADLLHTQGLTGVPVINNAGIVVGLVTEKELFSSDSKLYFPGYVKVLQETQFVIGGHKELPYVAEQFTRIAAKDIMNQSVFFASPDMPVEELAKAFIENNQSPVPVADAQNKLVGIVSRSDLVKLLAPSAGNNNSVNSHRIHQTVKPRPVDDELSFVHKDLSSRFAYVAKARANIWLTVAIVLFVVGFLIGVVYVANPAIIGLNISSGTTTVSPLNTNLNANIVLPNTSTQKTH